MDERQLKRECAILRARQRAAIERKDWSYYWLIQNEKMAIARMYLPQLFFGRSSQ